MLENDYLTHLALKQIYSTYQSYVVHKQECVNHANKFSIVTSANAVSNACSKSV